MVWSCLPFIFLTFVIRGDAVNRSEFFKLLPEPQTYQTAITACGAGYTLANDQSYHNELRSFLRQNAIKVAWLKITKKLLNQWTWVNGQPVDPISIYDGNNMQAKCGGVSLQDRNLRSMTCFERRNGFVCDVQGTQCPEKHFTQGCITYASNVLVIGCKAINWFDARTYCKSIGGDLAIVGTEGKMQAVFNYIISGKLADKCSWLFVGIRKEDWILTNESTGNETILKATLWAKNEPRPAGGSCVQMESLQADYSWKTAHCSDIASVVCQKYSHEANEQSTLEKDESRNNAKEIIILGVLLAVSLLLLLGVLAFLAITYFRKRVRMKSQETQETIPLIAQLPEKITSLKPQGDAKITVVMFSKGIEKRPTNINIPADGISNEKASDTARAIYREFSDVLKHSSDSMFSKENTRKVLQIVNIRAPDASYQLGRTQTGDFLTYLIKNKDWIDVVYLPGLRRPISHKKLLLFKELRKSCVILCYAKRNLTEIPSSEGLSFGIFKTSEEEIRSGIIDILLKEKEEHVTDVNTNVAVAKAAGMIAAVLYVARKKGKEIYESMKNTSMMRKYLINFARATMQEDVPGYGTLCFDEETMKDITGKLQTIYDDILKETKQIQVLCPKKGPSTSLKTRESLEDSLRSIKNAKGTKITIVFAASPISESTMEIDGISVESKSPAVTDDVSSLGHKFLPYISALLKHVTQREETTTRPVVSIIIVPIRSDDKESASDWILYHGALMHIKELKPDIVYISSDSRSSPRGLGIKRIIMQSKKQSIFITGAKGFEGPVAPPAFPAESVMTISRKGGPQGSLIDFISSTDQKEFEAQDAQNDDPMKEAWVAAADTVCAAVAVLLKARELDIEENILKNLRTTTVMRNVLLHMCSHYPEHQVEDGYGILQPHTVLKDEKYFKELVTLYGGENMPRNYWSGKEIQ